MLKREDQPLPVGGGRMKESPLVGKPVIGQHEKCERIRDYVLREFAVTLTNCRCIDFSAGLAPVGPHLNATNCPNKIALSPPGLSG